MAQSLAEPRRLFGSRPPDFDGAAPKPVLVLAEDDARVARALVRLLQESFRVTDVVTDGETLIARVDQVRPDVVVTDVWLDGMDGLSATTAIRRQVSIPIVVITGSDEPTREDALAAGASAFVHKQDIHTLVGVLQAVLGGQRFGGSPIGFTEPTEAPAPHRHEMVFCSDDAAIVDALARFTAAALNAADAAIVLVTESHRPRLLQGLRAQGVDIDGAIARGTYRSFDADEAPDPVRFREAINGLREAAVTAGNAHPRVAFGGERAGRLWAQGRTAEAMQLEQLCGELAHDVDILCVYPVPYQRDDHALHRICGEHTAVSAS